MVDKELIERCVKGKRSAQIAFYKAFAQRMFAHCYRYLRNKQDAEEILSEGFIKVFKNLSVLEFRDAKSTEAWVKRIMVNECLMFLRKNQKVREDDIEHHHLITESTIEMEINAQDVYTFILQLPVGYRTVFNLYVIEGYSHKEIAKKLGIGESTSRSQLVKARNILKKNMAKWN
ncbi:MAG: RNA polymerase sigma factor [Bacteroidota bacterium]